KDIEAGNFQNLSATYLKGFIKIYAKFLGVEVLQSFEQSKQPVPLQPLAPQPAPVPPKPKPAEKKQSQGMYHAVRERLKKVSPKLSKAVGKVAVGVVLFAAIIGAVRFAFGKLSNLFHQRPPAAVEAPVQTSLPIVEKGKELVVSLTTKKKCFIKVVVDGKLMLEGVLDKGTVESWKGKKEIEFKISDGSAIYLEVNGKSIPTLTSIRKPIKSLKITPSGITVDK
ncbi:MAG: RodZ domain-containing protein, partial [Elusimicrobiota bacterium]